MKVRDLKSSWEEREPTGWSEKEITLTFQRVFSKEWSEQELDLKRGPDAVGVTGIDLWVAVVVGRKKLERQGTV